MKYLEDLSGMIQFKYYKNIQQILFSTFHRCLDQENGLQV